MPQITFPTTTPSFFHSPSASLLFQNFAFFAISGSNTPLRSRWSMSFDMREWWNSGCPWIVMIRMYSRYSSDFSTPSGGWEENKTIPWLKQTSVEPRSWNGQEEVGTVGTWSRWDCCMPYIRDGCQKIFLNKSNTLKTDQCILPSKHFLSDIGQNDIRRSDLQLIVIVLAGPTESHCQNLMPEANPWRSFVQCSWTGCKKRHSLTNKFDLRLVFCYILDIRY